MFVTGTNENGEKDYNRQSNVSRNNLSLNLPFAACRGSNDLSIQDK